MPALRAAHLGLDLLLDVSDALRDFDADEVDAALRSCASPPAGLHAQQLFVPTIVAVCSPALLASGPPLRTPADFLAHRLCQVTWRSGHMVWPNWRMWMAAAGVDQAFYDSRCLGFDDTSYVVDAVVQGAMVELVELELIGEDLAAGRLRRLFDVALPVQAGYAYRLVFPESRRDDGRIVALATWLAREADALPG